MKTHAESLPPANHNHLKFESALFTGISSSGSGSEGSVHNVGRSQKIVEPQLTLSLSLVQIQLDRSTLGRDNALRYDEFVVLP